MTIHNMMQSRAALTAQMDAAPTDLSSEAEFKEIFERRWALEDSILSRQATTPADRDRQISILAARAADGGDVSLGATGDLTAGGR
ncbi:MAG: hypothetical protein WAV38_05225 [Xanthobacteraceae bacterium]